MININSNDKECKWIIYVSSEVCSDNQLLLRNPTNKEMGNEYENSEESWTKDSFIGNQNNHQRQLLFEQTGTETVVNCNGNCECPNLAIPQGQGCILKLIFNIIYN